MKETNNIGKSIRTKLLNIAQGNGVNYQVLLIRYIQERLLYRLSQSTQRNHFVLKGGALLYAIQDLKARPTLDLDFLGQNIRNNKDVLLQAFREIALIPCPEDAVTFDPESLSAYEITVNRKYQGICIQITAHLDSIRQLISMDIGFGDIITPGAQNLDYPLALGNLPQASILAYSIETLLAEKFEAMISLGEDNSRMKDFFDVYTILHSFFINDSILKEAIYQTFQNRHTHYTETPTLFSDSFAESHKRELQWNNFLKKIQYNSRLSFFEVHRYICHRFRSLLPDGTNLTN